MFFFSSFDMDHFLAFIECVTTLFLFYVLVFWPGDMECLGSLTRDWTPCSGRWNLILWTTRKVCLLFFFFLLHNCLAIFVILSFIICEWIFSPGSPVGLVVENLPAYAGDMGLIPGWRRSPGGGHDNPLSILAWEIPWTKEPDGLPKSIRLQKKLDTA